MILDDDEIADAPGWALQKHAKLHENILVNLYWWLFGMPPTEELRDRYSPRPFDDEQEERIREIVREEIGSDP